MALERVDVHHHDIAAVAVVDQREDRRVTHVAAVPIMLAVDLDGLEEEGEASGGKYPVGADLVALEDANLARPHVRGRQKELDRTRALTERSEVDAGLEHVFQRI